MKVIISRFNGEVIISYVDSIGRTIRTEKYEDDKTITISGIPIGMA